MANLGADGVGRAMSETETDIGNMAKATISDLFLRVRDKAFPHIESATVPIYGFQDDEVRHNRTGVLFRIADTHFILTAAHDLQTIVQAGIPRGY
jgi:hypothetical protein